jgi:arylsulfatase A-like enzyme
MNRTDPTWQSAAALLLAGTLACAPQSDAEHGVRTTVPPDIVIVILDAARAGNFGVFGYERDTSPNIDALARESLVFTRAYSECPTTACSIPNLISGLPFVHQETEAREQRIDDRVVTLAESLGEIGYRTIGISANPKNSRARNGDQGFDEFLQLWQRSGRRQPELQTDPQLLTDSAIQFLGHAPTDQPLFLQLHYVPPHEPYRPTPEFDRFGDPGYDGPVVPGFKLKGVRTGRIELDAADRAELLAHYDGNLLMADAAVGRLFDALKQRGRWDSSVVLVVSDHGEAFFEHGEQGHNTTLFDEMLHIPFILRLPPRADVEHVDTGQVVALSDVVPTILGFVGLAPAPGVNGVDLIAAPPDPGRVLFHRRIPYGKHFAVRGQ